MIFTAFPLGARACLDKDVTADDGELVYQFMPFMYKEGKASPIFNVKNFLLSLLRGIVHGVINFVFTVYVLWLHSADNDGHIADLWFTSVVLYTNIVFTVSFRLLTVQKTWTHFNWPIMLLLSWLLYVLFVLYLSESPGYNSNGVFGIAFSSLRMYLLLILVCGLNFLIDLSTYSYTMFFMKNLTQTLRILVKEVGELNDESQLTPDLQMEYDKYKAAVAEGANGGSPTKTKKKDNKRDLDKIDGIPQLAELASISSDRDEEVKEKDKTKKIPKPSTHRGKLRLTTPSNRQEDPLKKNQTKYDRIRLYSLRITRLENNEYE